MDQHGVGREKVPSSDCDCDKDEDFNLLTVINEHSEVIGLIKDDRNTNSQIGQNGVTDSNLMIIQMEMEMNLTLVKIILMVRLMKMTVTVKIRNITWFPRRK